MMLNLQRQKFLEKKLEIAKARDPIIKSEVELIEIAEEFLAALISLRKRVKK